MYGKQFSKTDKYLGKKSFEKNLKKLYCILHFINTKSFKKLGKI